MTLCFYFNFRNFIFLNNFPLCSKNFKNGRNSLKIISLASVQGEKEEKNRKINEYENSLPKSFKDDPAAPYMGSFMWLQRIGRLDLNQDPEFREKKNQLDNEPKIDPLFLSDKKLKKRKKNVKKSTISIGREKEEKILNFDFNTKIYDLSASLIVNSAKNSSEKTKFIQEHSFVFTKIINKKFENITKNVYILLLGVVSSIVCFF